MSIEDTLLSGLLDSLEYSQSVRRFCDTTMQSASFNRTLNTTSGGSGFNTTLGTVFSEYDEEMALTLASALRSPMPFDDTFRSVSRDADGLLQSDVHGPTSASQDTTAGTATTNEAASTMEPTVDASLNDTAPIFAVRITRQSLAVKPPRVVPASASQSRLNGSGTRRRLQHSTSGLLLTQLSASTSSNQPTEHGQLHQHQQQQPLSDPAALGQQLGGHSSSGVTEGATAESNDTSGTVGPVDTGVQRFSSVQAAQRALAAMLVECHEVAQDNSVDEFRWAEELTHLRGFTDGSVHDGHRGENANDRTSESKVSEAEAGGSGTSRGTPKYKGGDHDDEMHHNQSLAAAEQANSSESATPNHEPASSLSTRRHSRQASDATPALDQEQGSTGGIGQARQVSERSTNSKAGDNTADASAEGVNAASSPAPAKAAIFSGATAQGSVDGLSDLEGDVFDVEVDSNDSCFHPHGAHDVTEVGMADTVMSVAVSFHAPRVAMEEHPTLCKEHDPELAAARLQQELAAADLKIEQAYQNQLRHKEQAAKAQIEAKMQRMQAIADRAERRLQRIQARLNEPDTTMSDATLRKQQLRERLHILQPGEEAAWVSRLYPYAHPRPTTQRDDKASPRAGSPRAGSPRAGSPRAGSPRAGSPRAGSPRAGSPRASSPRAGSPRASSPRAGSPRAGSPRAGSPRAGSRRGSDAASVDSVGERAPPGAAALEKRRQLHEERMAAIQAAIRQKEASSAALLQWKSKMLRENAESQHKARRERLMAAREIATNKRLAKEARWQRRQELWKKRLSNLDGVQRSHSAQRLRSRRTEYLRTRSHHQNLEPLQNVINTQPLEPDANTTKDLPHPAPQSQATTSARSTQSANTARRSSTNSANPLPKASTSTSNDVKSSAPNSNRSRSPRNGHGQAKEGGTKTTAAKAKGQRSPRGSGARRRRKRSPRSVRSNANNTGEPSIISVVQSAEHLERLARSMSAASQQAAASLHQQGQARRIQQRRTALMLPPTDNGPQLDGTTPRPHSTRHSRGNTSTMGASMARPRSSAGLRTTFGSGEKGEHLTAYIRRVNQVPPVGAYQPEPPVQSGGLPSIHMDHEKSPRLFDKIIRDSKRIPGPGDYC